MDRLAHLQALTTTLSGPVSSHEAAAAVLTHALAALGADTGAVLLLSEGGTELVPLHAAGRPDALAGAARLPLDAPGPLAAAVRERAPVVRPAPGGGATVALPLLARGRAVGALELTLPAGRVLAEADRAFL